MEIKVLNKIIEEIENLGLDQLLTGCKKYDSIFKVIPQMVVALNGLNLEFFRVRDIDDNVNEGTPCSFSYKPESLKPAINRLNLEGESTFYGALFPHISMKESNVECGKEFYISKWTIDGSANLILYRLFDSQELVHNKKASEAIDYFSSVKQDGSIDLLFAIADNILSIKEGTNKYNLTALYANYLRRNRTPELKNEDGEKGKIKIDGFLYRSVKSNNHDELNLALFPDVIDKWAKLNYVLKGSIDDAYEIITGVKGIFNGEEIKWSDSIEQFRLKEL